MSPGEVRRAAGLVLSWRLDIEGDGDEQLCGKVLAHAIVRCRDHIALFIAKTVRADDSLRPGNHLVHIIRANLTGSTQPIPHWLIFESGLFMNIIL